MLTRAFFALLLIASPLALAVKIWMQRRALGRSPVVLGVAADGAWARWFERFSPLGLLFWPAAWLWIVLGRAPLNTNPGRGRPAVANGSAVIPDSSSSVA